MVQLKYNPLISFYICFVVDPHFEDVRKKGQGVNKVKAFSKFPENWNDDINLIAEIVMTKEKFDYQLKNFIVHIENYKRNKITN